MRVKTHWRERWADFRAGAGRVADDPPTGRKRHLPADICVVEPKGLVLIVQHLPWPQGCILVYRYPSMELESRAGNWNRGALHSRREDAGSASD